LEYALVYLGVQVGLAGPIGLLRQHALRDFAQRLPRCHKYLRHGSSPWRDAWWHWLIGYFAHNHGGLVREVRGAAVQGRNIRFTSLLTMGECWHNNHHAFPGSAKLGLASDEWDPGWWTILALQRVGLIWNIRLPADMPPRPELVVAPVNRQSSELYRRKS
jgi:hypothetical protein